MFCLLQTYEQFVRVRVRAKIKGIAVGVWEGERSLEWEAKRLYGGDIEQAAYRRRAKKRFLDLLNEYGAAAAQSTALPSRWPAGSFCLRAHEQISRHERLRFPAAATHVQLPMGMSLAPISCACRHRTVRPGVGQAQGLGLG